MSGSGSDPLVKAAFCKNPLIVGDGACVGGQLARSNRVLFSLGCKAYCDSRLVAMAALGEGERKGGTDGGHRGPNSHARAPIALPSPLEESCIELRLLSLPYSDVNPIRFHGSFGVPTVCRSFTSN